MGNSQTGSKSSLTPSPSGSALAHKSGSANNNRQASLPAGGHNSSLAAAGAGSKRGSKNTLQHHASPSPKPTSGSSSGSGSSRPCSGQSDDLPPLPAHNSSPARRGAISAEAYNEDDINNYVRKVCVCVCVCVCVKRTSWFCSTDEFYWCTRIQSVLE